jgi:flagellar biosynthesis/type III secretory pathway protein FliH
MAFDDELRRTIETLTERVRTEVMRQLSGVTDELSAAAAAERRAAAFDAAASARSAAEEEAETRLTEALATAAAAERAAELRGHEKGREEGREEGRRAGLEEGRREGVETGRREGQDEGREEGRDAGYRLGREAGLAEGRAEGEQTARTEWQNAAAAASERLLDAFRAIDRARSLTEILDTLASCAMREASRVAILVAEGEALRGWRVMGFPAGAEQGSAIEIPLANGGVLAEAVASGGSVSDATSSAAVPAFAMLPQGRPFAAVPIKLGADIVGVLYADQGPDANGAPVSGSSALAPWGATIEVLVRHAARCLEAVTAVRAAQAVRVAPSISAGAGDNEEDARRYAKLLVSEIKLYHEAEVLAGRRERDLATRLGGEIARARTLYEQRLPAQARRGPDHFQSELVRMLADGDASLLEVRS